MASKECIDALREDLQHDIEGKGYWLNPDRAFVDGLLDGLLENTERYGYRFCPCRLATGKREKDRDLICPCDYRDDDLAEYGACYCALYVDEAVAAGEKRVRSIPERRNPVRHDEKRPDRAAEGLAYPVYRCRVCGYLMAKDQPPGRCPICGVARERFERFL